MFFTKVQTNQDLHQLLIFPTKTLKNKFDTKYIDKFKNGLCDRWSTLGAIYIIEVARLDSSSDWEIHIVCGRSSALIWSTTTIYSYSYAIHVGLDQLLNIISNSIKIEIMKYD